MHVPRPKTATLVRRRTDTDERAERLLADALKGRGGALTRADAVALTGLSTTETDSALKSLLRRYKSHLSVTEQGELVYRFDPAMARRDEKTLGEHLADAARLLWRGFTFLFKIWIVATLIIYVIAFIAMMILLIFARSASDRDDRDSGPGLGVNPWLLYWLMPDWAPAGYYDRGYGRPRRLPGPRKRFYQSVFDYVFGPKRAPDDPLAGDREVVAYLREKGGRITATDLVALTGWSYDRAEQEATRLLASYDGEAEIAEDGTLVYAFPELRRTTGELGPTGEWRYAWGKERALAPLTGNTGGTNTAITVMNGFNLVAALAIGPAFLLKFGIDTDLARLAVTYFPLAFSSIFFAVPTGRALRRTRAARRLADDKTRAALIRAILARRGAPALPDELLAAAVGQGTGTSDEARAAEGARAKAILDALLVELDGDVIADDEGRTRYRFPRVAEELAAAEAARSLAPAAEREAGPVVFSSDAEGSGEVDALAPPAVPRGQLTN